MSGLLQKIWLEVRWTVMWFSLGLAAIMALLTILLPRVLGDIHQMFERLPMIRPLITALLGVDPGERISSELSQGFLWVHPTVLALIWAHEILYCTRMPAGEIDQGTADFLLCLPVSRVQVLTAETLGWLASGLCILAAGWCGHLLAALGVAPAMRMPFLQTLMVMANLGAVYLAVGSFAFLICVCSGRRGRAVGVVFAVLLASFLLNFLALFLDWAKALSPWLSVLEYYRPAIISQTGRFPWFDVSVLVGLAAVQWTAAAVLFGRRSISTT